MKNNSSIKEIYTLALREYEKNNFAAAEKLYNKILKINPNHFETVFLLGTLLAQNRQFSEAKKLLEKAIQISPEHLDSYNNLGNVLVELSEFKQAINCYERAIEINSNYIDTHFNYGNILKKLGKYKKAISSYEKVIQINPNYNNVYNNLGIVFRKLGEYKKAINCYEKEIQMQPANAGSYYNLGIVLKEVGEYHEAVNCYEKAVKINPNDLEARHNLGNTLEALGQFEQAINCYEKVLEYQPENLEYYFYLCLLKREILDINLEKKIYAIMEKKNLSKNNMAYGNFLLSKYELNKKNYKKELNFLITAHSYYYQSNQENYNKQNNYILNILPKINKLINLDNSNKGNKQIDDSVKPIFIVGVPRCGSTLIEKIITSGSKFIPMGEETGILSYLVKQKILDGERLVVKDDFKKLIFENYRGRKLIEENGDNIFTDKSLENFFYVGIIKKIFPHAKIINCKRNELSSIVSILQNNLIKSPWAHNLEQIFKYFDIYYRTIENYNKIYPNFIYELQFENFINDPEEESKKLMKYCELPWDAKCLEFYKRKDLISETASRIQIRKAIYTHSKKRYMPYKKFLDEYGKRYSWYN